MREKYDLEVDHIISEPGDGTRYDYIFLKVGDDFIFAPVYNTFRYPQRLNYWDVKDMDEEEILKLAKKENCNPWTLKECIRTTIDEFEKRI